MSLRFYNFHALGAHSKSGNFIFSSIVSTNFWSACRGRICPCRQCQRQCKISVQVIWTKSKRTATFFSWSLPLVPTPGQNSQPRWEISIKKVNLLQHDIRINTIVSQSLTSWSREFLLKILKSLIKSHSNLGRGLGRGLELGLGGFF